jgi:vacuolar protein sorting-associated protein 13A/C
LYGGITGVVNKPIEGAKEEGFQGFMKGFGKGILGAITKPTGGIIDSASQSLEGIRK